MNKTTRTYNEYELDCPVMGYPMIFEGWVSANAQVRICRNSGHEIKIRARNVIEIVQATEWEDATNTFPVAEETK